MVGDHIGDAGCKLLTIDGERAPGRNRRRPGNTEDKGIKELHLALEKPCRMLRVVTAKRVAAHEFGQVTSLVSRRALSRSHLVKNNRHVVASQLKCALRAGKSTPYYVHGFQSHALASLQEAPPTSRQGRVSGLFGLFGPPLALRCLAALGEDADGAIKVELLLVDLLGQRCVELAVGQIWPVRPVEKLDLVARSISSQFTQDLARRTAATLLGLGKNLQCPVESNLVDVFH